MADASENLNEENGDSEKKKKITITMANVPENLNQENGDSEKKKKNSLEEKSKDDLLKLVKKQLIFLQKAKNKSDELTAKCSVLEQEKGSIVQKHSLIQDELQTEIEILKEKITIEKDNAVIKENEIMKIQGELKDCQAEKNKYIIALREKDEQIQCLNMKLDTMKATCQCFQDELERLQKSNKEVSDEVKVLLDARDTALHSLKEQTLKLDSKIKECNDLTSSAGTLQKKYDLCIEENCSEIKSLETEIKSLKGDNACLLTELGKLSEKYKSLESKSKGNDQENCNDLSILIMDNEKLHKKVKDLEKMLESENKTLSQSDVDNRPFINKSHKKLSETEKENLELLKNLCEVESKNVQLSKVKEEFEQINSSLSEQVAYLKEKNSKIELELVNCKKEKNNLEEEVKKLVSLKEFDNYKSGFECAILHGASGENYDESENRKRENTCSFNQEKVSKNCDVACETLTPGLDSKTISYGLECALLHGGDLSHIMSEELETENVEKSTTAETNIKEVISVGFFNDLQLKYQDLEAEKINLLKDIAHLDKKCVEYSTLLEDVLKENESLKLERQMAPGKHKISEGTNTEQRVYIDVGVITTYDFSGMNSLLEKSREKLEITTSALNEEKILLTEKISLLEKDVLEYDKKCVSLSEELDILKEQNKKYADINGELELIKTNLKTQLELFEKQNFELCESLENKCAELNDFNLQLELLVLGIKQGVRQKTTVTNKTEKELSENISLLKVLLDDLILRANNNAVKVKNLEGKIDEMLIQKQNLEEELNQTRELNQFLEDEARALRDEVEQLKYASQNADQFNDSNCFAAPFQRISPELYCIEETNESEDKTCIMETDNTVSVEAPNHNIMEPLDVLVHTDHTEEDVTIQANLSTCSSDLVNNQATLPNMNDSDENEKQHNVSFETDEYKIVEKLKEENVILKNSLLDKSNLVETIHCEMDSLLTKVEELTVELQEKENELKNKENQNSELQKKVKYFHNMQNTALKNIQCSLEDFKSLKNFVSVDIKTLKSFFSECIVNLNNNISDVMSQYCGTIDNLKESCLHNEADFKSIGLSINNTLEDFELWINFLEGNTSFDGDHCIYQTLQENITCLEKTFQSSSHAPHFNSKYDENICCTVLKNTELLNISKQKLLFALYNHLNKSYVTVLKELENYESNIIPSLKETIADIKKKLPDNTSQEDASQNKKVEIYQTINCDGQSYESLKAQLADTELKMNKLKQIALKLKKELAETKKQHEDASIEKEKWEKKAAELQQELGKISADRCQYVQNYQSLQNEYDKLQDESEVQKNDKKKLEDDLANKLHELHACKEEIVELESQLKKSKQLLDASAVNKQGLEEKCADLESKVIVLESGNSEKIYKIRELEEEIGRINKELNLVMEEKCGLKQQLEHAQKEGEKKNLLDLEMADYERSIAELNNQVQKKDCEINELQNELRCLAENICSLQEEIKCTETLKETEEKRAASLKRILEKTKLELAFVKEHEAELLANTSSLQVRLEIMNQQEENQKIQLSEASAEIQHLKDMIKTSAENHQRIVRLMESKISNQKQEILMAHKEAESVKQEFENYKIRVHSVLKQQKATNPTFISVEPDLKEKLETMNEKLKLQVKDLNEKITAISLEYESLQEEHDNLLQRYNKVIDDRERKDAEWHQRLEQIQTEKNRLRAAQEELSSQHLLQNEMLVATYKKQIKIMSEEHKRTVSELQKQLDAADVEIARLQRDQQKLHGLPVSPTMQESSASFDILSQERQEGEGSESTDDRSTPVRHLSLATIPTSGFLPFEKLLQSPLEPGTPASYVSSHDTEKLTDELNTANKKIDHLSELLNESESTNLRLGEQVRVLKEEVRRLERNKEREQHAENLEYLKNVFIKFSTLQPCSEKAMLIPVLTTMLKLSPDEQQQLRNIAGDMDPIDSSSGWGSYLHRWSGLA